MVGMGKIYCQRSRQSGQIWKILLIRTDRSFSFRRARQKKRSPPRVDPQQSQGLQEKKPAGAERSSSTIERRIRWAWIRLEAMDGSDDVT